MATGRRTFLTACCWAIAAWTGVARGEEPRWTLALDLGGVRLEGTAISWSQSQVHLLGRDGRLWSFAPSEARDFSRASDTFRGYSAAEMRSRLTAELGKGFEVSGTGHYLVAHPAGQRDLWSPRFEALYRSFFHYFSVRGLDPTPPDFPLVAIVHKNQLDFMRSAAQEGERITANVLGYYSPTTNRISLFDVGAGRGDENDWQTNADTIIHEATHQTAFNTGVHRRFSAAPQWLVEGLGTLFEAPGVWDSRSHTRRQDRINRGRLREFQSLLPSRPAGRVADMVTSDRLFNADANAAYAEAWSLAFFLVETQPRQFTQYLSLTARRGAFEPYSATDRLADFTSVFGSDVRMIESRFLRFMADVASGAW